MRAIESKKKAADAKAKQKELIAEKQAKMLVRVDELTAQVNLHLYYASFLITLALIICHIVLYKGEPWAQMKAMREFMAEAGVEAKKNKAEFAKKNSVSEFKNYIVCFEQRRLQFHYPLTRNM